MKLLKIQILSLLKRMAGWTEIDEPMKKILKPATPTNEPDKGSKS